MLNKRCLLKKKEILASSLGNIVEWFDFGLFIFMAPIIGTQFFPKGSPALNTLEALMVFAAGFLCRPLGGLVFGYFGDTRGRAKTLRISILLITLSTLLVGIMPSYEQIGLLSPILFIMLRLVQGLSIGGEYSGVMIYLAESAPYHRRGFITSFAATGANLGFLLATLILLLLNHLFSKEIIQLWAWRLPFVFIMLPGSIIIYYRFKLSETHIYAQLKKNHLLKAIPLLSAIKNAPYQLLKILGLTCMGSTFYYVFVGYMPTYLEHYIGFSLQDALLIQLGLLVAMLGVVPLMGLCGDHWSRRTLLIATSIAIIVFVLPCFYGLQTKSFVWALLSLSMAVILSSSDQGNTLTAVVENCPLNVRYSGIAFFYNLGTALFGGTTPLMLVLLTEHWGFLAPAYYLMLMASVTLLTAVTLVKHNRSLAAIK